MAEHVVIVGGGFAGIKAAEALAHQKEVSVTLIDRQNYHLFQPLLYQVATASLEQESIAYPLRSLVQRFGSNVRFRLAEVTRIDAENKQLITPQANIPFDKLILATGMATNDYGTPGVDAYAYELKDLDDAVDLRSHMLMAFEKAAMLDNPEARSEWLTFVVVGGGATGVEFAGALQELVTHIVSRDYPEFDVQEEVHIVLLEAMDALFTGYDEPNQEFTRKRLEKMGVEVRLNTMVSGVEADRVLIKGDDPIATRCVLWAAGVRVTPLVESFDAPKARQGRIVVTPTLTVPDHPDIYAVGDIAYVEQDGQMLPGMAPVAMQMGRYAGEALLARLRGKEPEPFHYADRGKMAVIGRGAAIADVLGLNVRGVIAWLMWMGLHIYFLIGFQNRLQVMINWAFDYIFFERKVRLILRDTETDEMPAIEDGATPPLEEGEVVAAR
jgi:NADH dehydrogenase